MSMQALAQAHGSDAHGTLLLLAIPCGGHARARLSHLAGLTWQPAVALAVGTMAIIVVLPIPFGNLLPALALMLMGLGLVFRDGVAVVAGLAGAGLALAVTAGLVVLTWVRGRELDSGLDLNGTDR